MYNHDDRGRRPPTTLRMWAPGVTQVPPRRTARMQKQDHPRVPRGLGNRRPRWKRILKWGLIGGGGFTVLAVGTIAFLIMLWGADLPDGDALAKYQFKQVTVILDSQGKSSNDRIGEIFPEHGRRSVVAYEDVPPILVDSFVAAEDEHFWTHSGIDYWGMFRAFLANLRGSKQGASTITQQVVKNMLLTPRRNFKRKIQEIILARRLEQNLDKKEIMTLYMNQIFFGHDCYGVQEAARFYFGKDIRDVTIGEAALLAGLPQSPNNISPHVNPQRAKARQTYVLNRLVETKKLTMEEAKKWIDAPIQVVKDPFPRKGAAPEWVELVRKELIERAKSKDALNTLGAEVRTTLDANLQVTAQAALQKGLRAVDVRKKAGRPKKKIKPEAIQQELAKLAKRLPADGKLVAKTVYDAIVIAVPDNGELEVDLGNHPAVVMLGGLDDERYNPVDEAGARKAPSQRFAPGDLIEVIAAPPVAADKGDQADQPEAEKVKAPRSGRPRVAFAPGPQGAVVVIEVKTRKVRALVGGYDSKVSDFDRALSAERQPGSSFKPFVYAAAIASKKFTPASQLNDTAEVFALWKPQNYTKNTFEGPVLLRRALAKSINTVAIKLAHETGVTQIADLAEKMGITTTLPRELSLSLGSGGVKPIDMANAFATFAAGGKYAPPRFIESVNGAEAPGVEPTQVLAPEVAYVTVDMMRSVVEEGTGALARRVGVPIAGKTGTSNDARDVWFMGLTPDYVIGVWVGNDDNRPLGGKETGGTTAVPIFVEVAKAMKLKPKAFPRPAHVVDARIDRATGLLSPPGAPRETSYSEVFLEGTVPTEVAPMPGDVTADNLVTGEYED